MVRYRDAGLVLLLLISLAGAAKAAEGDPLAALPGQVAGVIGSGDQLSLRVNESGASRTLAVGSEYRDGWRVQSITPAIVTLGRQGESRRIGLNPSGAAGGAAADDGGRPIILTLLSAEELALLQRELDSGAWDGLAKRGLSLDESRRLVVCDARYLSTLGPGGSPPPSPECERLNRASMKANLNWLMANGPENERRSLQGLPPLGPASFYVAPGVSSAAAAQAAGISGLSGYSFGAPDAAGGYMMTRSDTTNPPIIARAADGSWDYIASIARGAGR